MEKRAIGVILTLLGVIALITGAYFFISRGDNTHNLKVMITFVILGLIFFVSGISLVRNTTDVMKKDERIS